MSARRRRDERVMQSGRGGAGDGHRLRWDTGETSDLRRGCRGLTLAQGTNGEVDEGRPEFPLEGRSSCAGLGIPTAQRILTPTPLVMGDSPTGKELGGGGAARHLHAWALSSMPQILVRRSLSA